MDPTAYLAELKRRLQNPSVSDEALTVYIVAAGRDVNPALYSASDYDAQILDTACQLLAIDNKFPEIQSVSSQGVSTSFSSNDPERYRRRIASRRAAAWMK
jgi:hypothetical protein